jgi:hypothetical protein
MLSMMDMKRRRDAHGVGGLVVSIPAEVEADLRKRTADELVIQSATDPRGSRDPRVVSRKRFEGSSPKQRAACSE